VRNALTKMSHLHFTSTEGARARVIAMGEEPWRVHRAGAPSLDHLRRSRLLDRSELEERLHLALEGTAVMVAYHPVTLLRDTTQEADALFAALQEIDGQVIFCYPNSDAGNHALLQRTRSFLSSRSDARLFVNLDAVTYWSLLREVAVLIGNSSSGIMEAASFAVPVVNVGFRQKGRERARNVLDAEPDASAIVAQIAKARSPVFRDSLSGMINPYGDGHAAETIVRVLTTTPLEGLLVKRANATP
jgi:UDP-hydrolysing UDP-N-acetyl-D-glucosamine 2-epimerase